MDARAFSMVFVLVAGLGLVMAGPRLADRHGATVVLLGLLLWSSGVLAYEGARSRPRLLRATVYLYVLVFVCIAPLAQVSARQFPSPESPDEGSIARAVFLHVLGVGFFEIGRVALRRRTIPDAPRTQNVQYKQQVWLGVLLLCIAAAILGGTLIGWESLWSSRDALAQSVYGDLSTAERLASDKTNALLLKFTQVPIVIAVLFGITLCRIGYGFRGRRMLLLVSLAVLAAVNNPISSSRYWFAGVVLSLCAASVLPHVPPRRFRVTLVLAVVALTVLFPAFDAFRHADPRLELLAPRESLVAEPDYSPFINMTSALRVVDADGHTMGRQTAGWLFVALPRGLWSAKPLDTGQLFVINTASTAHNPSASLFVEWYVEFGAGGIAIGFFALGKASSALDRGIRAGTPYSWCVYALLAGFGVMIMRGSTQPVAATLVPLVVGLTFVMWATKRRQGDRRTEGMQTSGPFPL